MDGYGSRRTGCGDVWSFVLSRWTIGEDGESSNPHSLDSSVDVHMVPTGARWFASMKLPPASPRAG